MRRRLLLWFLLVSAALSGARAAPIEYRAQNLNIEEARKLVAKGRFEDALEELKTAEGLPGNTNRQRADILELRATALLALPPLPPRQEAATEAIVELAHVDPDGITLQLANDQVKAFAQQVRSQRLILLTDRLVTARSGRPLRIRARVVGAQPGAPQVYVSYRIEREESDPRNPQPGFDEEYVRVPLEPAGGNLYEVFLRPGVGGIPERGEHVLRYYLEATGAGALLDSNGTGQAPIRVQLSETLSESAGVGGLAALDEGGKPAHPPPPPPPRPPWYQRWEIVGPLGGALVVGGVLAAVLLQPKPQPQAGSLGRVDLP